MLFLLVLGVALALSLTIVNTGTATARLDLLGPILEEGFQTNQYVAHKVLPPLPVEKQAGAIPSFLFTDAQLLNILHAPKTGYARIQSQLGQKTFNCAESGVEEPLSVEDYNIMGRDMAERQVSRKLVDIVLRARDAALAATLLSVAAETTFSGQVTTATGSAAWDNASGVPLTDIEAARESLESRVGQGTTALLIGRGALTKLRTNAQLRSAYRNIAGINDKKAVMSNLSEEQVCTALGIDELIVGSGVKNTIEEGLTPSLSFIFPSTYALLFQKSPPGQMNAVDAGLGRTFVWDQAQIVGDWATGSVDALLSLIIEQYREEGLNSDVLRAREYINMVLLNPKAAQLIKSI